MKKKKRKTRDKPKTQPVLINFDTYQIVANESHRRKTFGREIYERKEKSITHIVSDAVRQVYET